MEQFPHEERREVRSIFEQKGYRGKALDTIVEHVTADPKFWVDTMMTEELGLSVAPTVAPIRSGLVVALAYAVGAAFPVLPYAWPLSVDRAFLLSIALTLTAPPVLSALMLGVATVKLPVVPIPPAASAFTRNRSRYRAAIPRSRGFRPMKCWPPTSTPPRYSRSAADGAGPSRPGP